MSRTLTTAIAARFHDLADTLTRNATLLGTAGLPEAVAAIRVTVYGDVAAQLRLLAEAEQDHVAAGNPLVLVREAGGGGGAAVRDAGRAAGRQRPDPDPRHGDAVMHRRAGVYRDVAAQVRLLAEVEREAAMACRPPPAGRRCPTPHRCHRSWRRPRCGCRGCGRSSWRRWWPRSPSGADRAGRWRG